jgi:hypothetical protein
MATLNLKCSGLSSPPFGSPGGGGTGLREASISANRQKEHKASLRVSKRIATWNVCGLLQSGKLAVIEKEMNLHKLDILGLSETHWRGCGFCDTRKKHCVLIRM